MYIIHKTLSFRRQRVFVDTDSVYIGTHYIVDIKYQKIDSD